MTKTEIKRMNISIRKLEKCNGDCIKCENMKMKTAPSENSNIIVYAVYCDIDENIQPYSSSTKNLKAETLEALKFELGVELDIEKIENRRRKDDICI